MLSNLTDSIEGKCTVEGNKRYLERSKGKVHPDNFKKPMLPPPHDELLLCKMQIGTYDGRTGNPVDVTQYMSIKEAIKSGGCNYIDTGVLER